jgi:hypothetical protein
MELLGGIVSFLGAIAGGVLSYLFTRKKAFKEKLYEGKIAAYEELSALLSDLMGALVKAYARLGKENGKSLEEIFEEEQVPERIMALYLFTYRKGFILSRKVVDTILTMLALCDACEAEGCEVEGCVGAFAELVNEAIDLMREDLGTEPLSRSIQREIYKPF